MTPLLGLTGLGGGVGSNLVAGGGEGPYEDATNFWDFGDGNTSINVNPTKIYSAGSYSVKLIAKNGICSGNISKSY